MKKNIKYIIYIFISIVLFITSFLLFQKSIHNYTQDIIKCTENSTIDYKVYLKENNYFDSPYLEEDKVYITSLIDYIDIDFLYDLKLDSQRSGKYTYYIKGVMSANVNNTDKDYWQKTYDLTPSQEVTYNNTDNIKFSKNIKIDYQTYNNLLLQFKEEYKLSIDGTFKVYLYIENDIESDIGEDLNQITITNLEIPLTKSTIEVPIETTEINNTKNLTGDLIYNDTSSNNILKISSIIIFILGIALIIFSVFKIVRSLEKISSYNKELRKILKTYDGIIVNVSKLPNFTKTNIIDVNSFNELLDAHGEIRQPISYYEVRKKATFVLINGDIIWRYILKDNEYEK